MVSPILRFPPTHIIVLIRETLKFGRAISSAMQPFQLFSCSGSSIAAIAGAAVQLWQLSSSSSLAFTAQLHQQRSILQQFQLRQPCSLAAVQPCSRLLAALQPCSLAALQPCSLAALQPCSLAAVQHQSAAWQPQATALQPQATALQLYSLTVLRSQ